MKRKGKQTYDDGEERILELLVRLLRHDVDTGEPAAVTRVRVIPTDDVFGTTDLFARKRKRKNKWRLRQFAERKRKMGGDVRQESSRCTES
jgi:hypothetical protein